MNGVTCTLSGGMRTTSFGILPFNRWYLRAVLLIIIPSLLCEREYAPRNEVQQQCADDPYYNDC